MLYEVWHTETNEKVGKIDVPRHVDHDVGARVIIKTLEPIEHKTKGKFNAIEMKVFIMAPEGKPRYYALETNLPMPLLKKLEGFTPDIFLPRLSEIVAINRTRFDQ